MGGDICPRSPADGATNVGGRAGIAKRILRFRVVAVMASQQGRPPVPGLRLVQATLGVPMTARVSKKMSGMLVLAVAAALMASVEAAPFPGSDIRYSGANATENDLNVAVAYNPSAGQYLVVWQDARQLGTRGYDIFGQRVDEDGTRLGANFRISDAAALSSEYTPAVTFSVTSNQYLVVWSDGRDGLATGTEIYGQRIRAGGSKAGGNFPISDGSGLGDEGGPAVAWNSNANQYLVVWEDTRHASGGSAWDIYGQRVRAGGALAGPNFRVSGPLGAPALASEFSPAAVFNATSNQYLVVWSDHRDYSTHGSDIYGARVKAGGLVVDADIVISGVAADGDDSRPDVAWNPNANQYLVAWTDTRNAPARGWDIYARRVKAGGTTAGLDFRVVDAYAISTEADPAVAFSPDADRYLVVWMDMRDAGTEGNNIYAQRVKAGGATPGDNFLVSGLPTNAQESHPDVAFGSGGGLHLIVWGDSRNNATRGSDIYGRLAAD